MTIKNIILAGVTSSLLLGCATGNTPADKKKNAVKETSEALQQIYEDHSTAKGVLNKSLGYLVCTGSDSYYLPHLLVAVFVSLKRMVSLSFIALLR